MRSFFFFFFCVASCHLSPSTKTTHRTAGPTGLRSADNPSPELHPRTQLDTYRPETRRLALHCEYCVLIVFSLLFVWFVFILHVFLFSVFCGVLIFVGLILFLVFLCCSLFFSVCWYCTLFVVCSFSCDVPCFLRVFSFCVVCFLVLLCIFIGSFHFSTVVYLFRMFSLLYSYICVFPVPPHLFDFFPFPPFQDVWPICHFRIRLHPPVRKTSSWRLASCRGSRSFRGVSCNLPLQGEPLGLARLRLLISKDLTERPLPICF